MVRGCISTEDEQKPNVQNKNSLVQEEWIPNNNKCDECEIHPNVLKKVVLTIPVLILQMFDAMNMMCTADPGYLVAADLVRGCISTEEEQNLNVQNKKWIPNNI